MDAEAVDNWMSIRSAAAHLECSERQIYRLISSGQLAAYKVGRLTRIRRRDLDRAILAEPRSTTTATQLRLLDADSACRWSGHSHILERVKDAEVADPPGASASA